ncbi:MAG: ATP-binding cassette domain-containing protein [Nostocaceae cyanobacterium]|nr:ATP-binding cassette domain-containing protein [Nostocaceae cyanobacterium]
MPFLEVLEVIQSTILNHVSVKSLMIFGLFILRYTSKPQQEIVEKNYLLELKNVTFRYRNARKFLLEDVNFQLLPGEKIGIVGDDGSGKSTIAKLFLGLCKPQKGFVRLFGEEVSWGNHYPMLSYIGDPSYNPGGLGLPTNILVGDLVDCFKKLWSNSIQDSSLGTSKE